MMRMRRGAIPAIATGLSLSLVVSLTGASGAQAATRDEQRIASVATTVESAQFGSGAQVTPEEVAAAVRSMDPAQLKLLEELDGLIAAASADHGAVLPALPAPTGDDRFGTAAIPAAYAAYVATCAYGALASVPVQALMDIRAGRASHWSDYVFNAVASCAVPVVGRWLWSVVGDWARKQFVSLVLSIVIRWF